MKKKTKLSEENAKKGNSQWYDKEICDDMNEKKRKCHLERNMFKSIYSMITHK